MRENITEFLKFSHFLADEANKISMRYFKKRIKIISKNKTVFDPVTIADISIQKKINTLINKVYPTHSILGEEDSNLKRNEYEWCIDPIDGTKSFIQGIPLWGTLISVAKDNNIILGLIDIPALGERYVGYSDVAYKIKNKKKIKLKVSNTDKLNDAIMNTTSPYVFKNKKDKIAFERLGKKIKSIRLGGDCYNYCLLADGYVDIVVETGLNPWDIRAMEPIIKNAGGIITTWNGKKIFNGGRIIACNNKKLLDQSIAILNKKNPV